MIARPRRDRSAFIVRDPAVFALLELALLTLVALQIRGALREWVIEAMAAQYIEVNR